VKPVAPSESTAGRQKPQLALGGFWQAVSLAQALPSLSGMPPPSNAGMGSSQQKPGVPP
jgi:hypothetical protein